MMSMQYRTSLADRRPQTAAKQASPAPVRAPAASEILQRASPCSCGGGCPSCQMKSAGASAAAGALRVSTPGDAYEVEADRVADSVMRMPEGSGTDSIFGTGSIGRFTQGATAQGATVSRAASSSVPAAAGNLSSVVAHGTRGGGRALDRDTRRFMESRFGRDFGAVRVHIGAQAAESARSVSAVAYTIGRDIVFGAGNYAPQTAAGRRLLAHELTHTIQQSGAAPSTIGRVAAPAIHAGASGMIQMVGECAGKSKANCSGSCQHSPGLGGFCTWSGSIANGCICVARDQPGLSRVQQFLFNLVIAALIAAAIVITLEAIAAIVVCLMGPCEVAALIAALGVAGAAIVMGIIGTKGSSTSEGGGETAAAPPAAPSAGAAA